jgi:hypothetical protein
MNWHNQQNSFISPEPQETEAESTSTIATDGERQRSFSAKSVGIYYNQKSSRSSGFSSPLPLQAAADVGTTSDLTYFPGGTTSTRNTTTITSPNHPNDPGACGPPQIPMIDPLLTPEERWERNADRPLLDRKSVKGWWSSANRSEKSVWTGLFPGNSPIDLRAPPPEVGPNRCCVIGCREWDNTRIRPCSFCDHHTCAPHGRNHGVGNNFQVGCNHCLRVEAQEEQ